MHSFVYRAATPHLLTLSRYNLNFFGDAVSDGNRVGFLALAFGVFDFISRVRFKQK